MRVRVLVTCFAAFLALGCGTEAQLPRELLGQWVCDDPRYADRSLTISARALLFSSGKAAMEAYEVRAVEPGDANSYRVTYGKAGGADLELRLALSPTQPATLRLGERPEVWRLSAGPGGAPQ